jgi:peptidoglycan/xylan/chitin deacetylase (PgdA/CDA1 family)
MNTPLIKKYIEGDIAVVSWTGFAKAEEILVKGEFRIDGDEYRVSYDLAGASQISKDRFRILFSMEDLTNGVSYSDELFWSPGNDEAGILLSFDDDYWHVWPQYFAMFDSYGVKATFFVQGGLEADGSSTSGKKGLADFCAETLSRGHDLGFHSINHYDLTKVSQDVFHAETIEAAEVFSKAGIPLSAFAFPFGFSQPWMRETLAPVFPVSRGYGSNTRFYTAEINSGYIISKAIDNIMYPDDSEFEKNISLILLITKFTGNSIVPFTTHDISDTVQWGIKPKRLEFLLKTIQELKLKSYTYSRIIPH